MCQVYECSDEDPNAKRQRKSGRGRFRITKSEFFIKKLIKSKSTKIQEAQNPEAKTRSTGTMEHARNTG